MEFFQPTFRIPLLTPMLKPVGEELVLSKCGTYLECRMEGVGSDPGQERLQEHICTGQGSEIQLAFQASGQLPVAPVSDAVVPVPVGTHVVPLIFITSVFAAFRRSRHSSPFRKDSLLILVRLHLIPQICCYYWYYYATSTVDGNL